MNPAFIFVYETDVKPIQTNISSFYMKSSPYPVVQLETAIQNLAT